MTRAETVDRWTLFLKRSIPFIALFPCICDSLLSRNSLRHSSKLAFGRSRMLQFTTRRWIIPHQNFYIGHPMSSWLQTISQRRLQSITRSPIPRMFSASKLDGHHVCSKEETLNNSHYSSRTLSISVPTEDDMEQIGAFLSSLLLRSDSIPSASSGMVIFLNGGLGAGKTVFARGFIRSAVCSGDMVVTSPTYLLSNRYDVAGENQRLLQK
jgi:Threonylcarbamoyl adenosine biosynthesis protein TsaE